MLGVVCSMAMDLEQIPAGKGNCNGKSKRLLGWVDSYFPTYRPIRRAQDGTPGFWGDGE